LSRVLSGRQEEVFGPGFVRPDPYGDGRLLLALSVMPTAPRDSAPRHDRTS